MLADELVAWAFGINLYSNEKLSIQIFCIDELGTQI